MDGCSTQDGATTGRSTMEGIDAIRRARSRWLVHIARREPDHLTKLSQTVEVDGQRQRGRPLLTWTNSVDKDIDLMKLNIGRTLLTE